MRYEFLIGLRYLNGAHKDRGRTVNGGMVVGGLFLIAAGLGWLVLTNGHSAIAAFLLLFGLIFSAIMLLLRRLSVFTAVSVLGVTFGVAALTVVLGVTSGFQRQFREKVLGTNAHVIIQKSESTFADYRQVMDTAQAIDPDVLAVQPFVIAEMLVTRGQGKLSGVAIKGVDPLRVADVLDIKKHLIAGTIESLAAPPAADGMPAVIIGKELARKIKAEVGDSLTVVVPLSNLDFDTFRAKSSSPRTRQFRVTGIFYSGFDEYDRRLIYTALGAIQELSGRGDEVQGVELKVRDVERASAIAAKLSNELGAPFQVQDWFQLNHNLFTALTWQKLLLTIILTLIIAVAAFNMVSALTMLVTDKTREIAILKSQGATSPSVLGVFVTVGIAISAIGTLTGVGIGLAIAYIFQAYGFRLDPKVYLIDRLPIDVRYFEIALVCGITMLIGTVATIIPALRAAAMRPADGLRYD